MSIKLDKSERDRRAKMAAELLEAHGKLEDAVSVYNAAVQEARGPLDDAVMAFNEIVAEASGFVEDVASRIDGEIDDKSERWQDSERGEAARTFRDEWQNAALDEVSLDIPEDVEVPDIDHATTVKNLPEEPEPCT